MITDLLMRLTYLNKETDEPLDKDVAVEAVVDSVDRDVSDDERAELNNLLDSGWFDE